MFSPIFEIYNKKKFGFFSKKNKKRKISMRLVYYSQKEI